MPQSEPKPTRLFGALRTVAVIVAVVAGTFMLAPSSGATVPTTSKDARAAWQASTQKAEAAAEQLNAARQAQGNAEKTAAAAESKANASTAKLAAAQGKVRAANAKVAQYQADLDQFANASFQGADLSQVNALLMAGNADDFLDQASTLNQIATDTQTTITAATAAVAAANQAKAAATNAQQAADQARAQANAAVNAAKQTTSAATAKKSAMDAAVTANHQLFDKLSAAEKKAAAAAAAKQKAESAVAVQQIKSAVTQAEGQGMGAAAQIGASVLPNFPVSGGDKAGQIAARAALTKIGGGYCYACDGPVNYDCSGLTTWAWGQAGYTIPRVSYEQANFPSVPLDQLQPGDLVTYYSPVSHVAIYVGNGMVASAADEELGIILVPVDKGGPSPTGHRVPR